MENKAKKFDFYGHGPKTSSRCGSLKQLCSFSLLKHRPKRIPTASTTKICKTFSKRQVMFLVCPRVEIRLPLKACNEIWHLTILLNYIETFQFWLNMPKITDNLPVNKVLHEILGWIRAKTVKIYSRKILLTRCLPSVHDY